MVLIPSLLTLSRHQSSVKTPELNACFTNPYVIVSSVSSGLLCSVSTTSDNSKLQLTSSIKSHDGAQLGQYFCLYHWLARCQLLNSFPTFSSDPVTFAFWDSLPPNNITLNPINKKTDQSFRSLDLHWCSCSCHSTYKVVYIFKHNSTFWKVLSETELKFCSKLTSFRSQTWLLLLVCLRKCFPFEYPKECCSIQF